MINGNLKLKPLEWPLWAWLLIGVLFTGTPAISVWRTIVQGTAPESTAIAELAKETAKLSQEVIKFHEEFAVTTSITQEKLAQSDRRQSGIEKDLEKIRERLLDLERQAINNGALEE